MKNKLSLALITALCVTSASAMQFQTLGYKSVAMGGAGVASSSGSVATYNNPALLAKAEYDVEISMGGGVSYQDHGAGASMQALDDSAFIDTLDKYDGDISTLATDSLSGVSSDIQTLIDGKNIILDMDGDAVNVAPQAYFAAQIGAFGLGLFGSSDVVATANVPSGYDRLVFEDGSNYAELLDDGSVVVATAGDYAESIQYGVENGDINADIRAIALAEVPIAYGHKLELSGGNLMIGGALKYMQALTYTDTYNIDNTENANSSQLEETSTSFGVDLGLAYEPYFAQDLTLAVVGKNLNTPEFTFADGAIVKIKPMVRVGVAYNILESLEIAADVDVTKNETFVSGVENQMVGGGLNWHPASWFALRGGAMKNLDANDQADLIYTAGLGFGFKWFQLDLSGQVSNKTSTVGDTTLPQYAKVNLALISRW